MTDKDNEEKQLIIPGFEELAAPQIPEDSNWTTMKEPPKYEDLVEDTSKQEIAKEDKTTNLDAPALSIQQDTLPDTLKASAETSIDLRNVQRRLAELLTREDYVATIASYKPEVLPELMNSITAGIGTADNLMIKMAQEASKNTTMNRVFEYMTKNQEVQQAAIEQKQDELYDDSVEKIKRAIYKRLDSERNATHRTAQDYIDPADTAPHEIIDIEYEVSNNKEEETKEDE